ncbi:MAG: hypothetical protein QMC96_12445 [Methanomicrobiales archaeon]|nr:hypothetical protein [Methanomicrobiales archaeon]
MGYQDVRLQKLGVVVAYFCPVQEITPVLKNNLFAQDRSNDKGTVLKDKRMWHHEIVVQGEFLHTDELPDDHAEGLRSLFGVPDVTPAMQLRRVVAFALGVGGSFDLYVNDDAYTGKITGQQHYTHGGNVYPQVAIDEIRPIITGAHARAIPYTVKFIAGIPTGGS